MLQRTIREASAATLIALLPHYAAFYAAGTPLWTERIGEWIMARTPNEAALAMLERLGPWAKPFAMTGGLATLGFALWACWFAVRRLPPRYRLNALALALSIAAFALALLFEYRSLGGQLSFWLPALAALMWQGRERAVPAAHVPRASPTRRDLLHSATRLVVPAVMSSGTALVAVESYWREESLARRAVRPVPLYPFTYPQDREQFAPGLVRAAVTSIEPKDEFYRMSKAAVDPAVDPARWSLRITVDGRPWREFSYRELLSLPRTERYVTLRCVSNSLTSDWMDTASWSGLHLAQLADRRQLPAGIREVVFHGMDHYADSLDVAYAFSDEPLLALGMNGKTLNRAHGYPIRVLSPQHYGFRSVKWLREIAFVREPFNGMWETMGFTRNPIIQTASYIDRLRRAPSGWEIGGVSFAGTRGIRAVQVRVDQGPWVAAAIEPALSPYTLTRWRASVPAATGTWVEAQAQDGHGQWQATEQTPLFPTGVRGRTRRRLPA